jgi:dTDP-4-amino-4,6-dideoxygalactose transaminase
MIPITVVKIDSGVEALIAEVLASGRLAQGPMVERFEGLVAEMCGTKHAVAVSNGTISLVAALQAAGIGPGDEVVTSPFTFVASVNAILECGARVRFADIDPVTFCMSPEALAAQLTDSTAAVMPVHLYGQAADMEGILAAIGDRGLPIIEDAAQAHGAESGGKRVGSFGIGSFSFYATKNISTGEGGAVTTDDDAIADRLRLLRNQGMRERYVYEIAGHNYRMTELQAAVGIPQMERVEEINDTRRANAAALSAALADAPGIVVPAVREHATSVWHQYTIRVSSGSAVSRDDMVAGLEAAGIGCGIYYPRTAYDYDCYRSNPNVIISDCPEAERAALEVVSLPVHPYLSDGDIAEIGTTVTKLASG